MPALAAQRDFVRGPENRRVMDIPSKERGLGGRAIGRFEVPKASTPFVIGSAQTGSVPFADPHRQAVRALILPPPDDAAREATGPTPGAPLLDDAARRLRLLHVLRDAVRWALCTSPATVATEIASRAASSRRNRCAEAPSSALRWDSVRSARETFVRWVADGSPTPSPTAPLGAARTRGSPRALIETKSDAPIKRRDPRPVAEGLS